MIPDKWSSNSKQEQTTMTGCCIILCLLWSALYNHFLIYYSDQPCEGEMVIISIHSFLHMRKLINSVWLSSLPETVELVSGRLCKPRASDSKPSAFPTLCSSLILIAITLRVQRNFLLVLKPMINATCPGEKIKSMLFAGLCAKSLAPRNNLLETTGLVFTAKQWVNN